MARSPAGLSTGEYAILGLLRNRPMHGYEVARHFSSDLDLGLVIPLDMSSVYGLLKDLHEQGLIEGTRESAGSRPPRTVFHLSTPAESVLLRWLTEPVDRLREVRSSFLVKLYFCRQISGVMTNRLLGAQIEATSAYVERLIQMRDEHPIESFERMVFETKVVAAEATVRWIEREIRRLGS